MTDIYQPIRERALQTRVVFSDLDGTLLRPHGVVPVGFHEVRHRLEATGCRLIPTTGRTLVALREVFGPAVDSMDYIASNGLDVVCHGAIDEHRACAHADAERLLRLACQIPYKVGFAVFTPDDIYLMDLEAAMLVQMYPTTFATREVRSLAAGLRPDHICKVAIITCDPVLEVMDALDRCMGDTYEFACSNDVWIDVIVRGTSKADGIRTVLDHLGVTARDAMCFADSMNDYGMVELLPWSVAVANAMPQLAARCWHTIGTNTEESVVHALDAIARVRESAGLRA